MCDDSDDMRFRATEIQQTSQGIRQQGLNKRPSIQKIDTDDIFYGVCTVHCNVQGSVK